MGAVDSSRLPSALPESLQNKVTITAAVLSAPDGELVRAISRNGLQSAMDAGPWRLRGEAIVADDGVDEDGELIEWRDKAVDAEIRMEEYAKRNGATIVALGAGRPVCDPCVDYLDDAEVRICTRLKDPMRYRPHLKGGEPRLDRKPGKLTNTPIPRGSLTRADLDRVRALNDRTRKNAQDFEESDPRHHQQPSRPEHPRDDTAAPDHRDNKGPTH